MTCPSWFNNGVFLLAENDVKGPDKKKSKKGKKKGKNAGEQKENVRILNSLDNILFSS